MDVLCLEQGEWPDRADYPGPKPDWELQAMKQWAAGPERPRGPGRLPDRRLRVRHRAADVQRRRRLDGALRRRLAAPDAVRLPRPIARRRRRRLAAHVRGARAVLRPHRPPGRRRGPGERSGLPGGRRPPAAAAAARPRRDGRGARARPARLALVARALRDPLASVRGAPPVRAVGLVHAGLPGGREGVDRRHPLAAGDRARGPRGHGRARDPAPARPRRARSRGRSTWTPTAGPSARRRTSWCSPRTRSAARDCSSCPPAGRSRTASRTRAGSSGGA